MKRGLTDGPYATGTNRRMTRVRTDIRFPMPAAFAFLTFRFGNRNGNSRIVVGLQFELGNIEELAERLQSALGFGERRSRTCEGQFRLERFANLLGLPRLLQSRKPQLAQ